MHKTVKLWNNEYDDFIDIDTRIAPLIYEIWEADIETTMSCEDNWPDIFDDKDRCIWIEFGSEENLTKFLDIIFFGQKRCSDFLIRASNDTINNNLKWNYRIFIDTQQFEQDELLFKTYNLIDNFKIYYQLRFPACDYIKVLNKIYKYNKGGNYIDYNYNRLIKSHKKLLDKIYKYNKVYEYINYNYDRLIKSHKKLLNKI